MNALFPANYNRRRRTFFTIRPPLGSTGVFPSRFVIQSVGTNNPIFIFILCSPL